MPVASMVPTTALPLAIPFTYQLTVLGSVEMCAVNWMVPPVRISALSGVIEAVTEWATDEPAQPVKMQENNTTNTTGTLLKAITPAWTQRI